MLYITDPNVNIDYAAHKEENKRPGSTGTYINCAREYKIKPTGALELITEEKIIEETQNADQDEWKVLDEQLEPPGSELNLTLPPHDKIDLCVTAKAYAPEGTEVSSLVCEIKCGDYSKKRKIFGNRKFTQYLDGTSTISEPQLFQSMDIGPANCFGSKEFSLNRNGKGYIYRFEDNPEFAEVLAEIADVEERLAAVLEDEETIDTQIVDEGFADNVPDPFKSTTENENLAEPENIIEYQVDLPNVENPTDPYINPFTVIDHEGFFHSTTNVMDKIALARAEHNSDEGSFDFFEDVDESIYQQAVSDQQFDALPDGAILEFINMREDAPHFSISLPKEMPRCFLAKRLLNLELQEIVMRMTLISVDLVKNKVTILWQGKDDFPTTQSVMQELYDTKYVYAFFDNVPALKVFEEIQLDFSEKIQAIEEAEEAAIGPKKEDLEQKEKDILNVIVEQMKAIELNPDIIEDFEGQSSLEEKQDFFMKLVDKSKTDMEVFLEQIKKETEELKKQSNEI